MTHMRVGTRLRALLGTAVMVAVSAVILVAAPAQSFAAGGCSDGDRAGAQSVAASGQFIVPVGVVYSDGQAKIELRYATNGSRCVWGLISQAQYNSKVWIDRSTNGGSTWQGLLGSQYVAWGNSSTYTGLFNDANVVSRACGYQDHGYWSTQPGGVLHWVDVVGTTVCTAWW